MDVSLLKLLGLFCSESLNVVRPARVATLAGRTTLRLSLQNKPSSFSSDTSTRPCHLHHDSTTGLALGVRTPKSSVWLERFQCPP